MYLTLLQLLAFYRIVWLAYCITLEERGSLFSDLLPCLALLVFQFPCIGCRKIVCFEEVEGGTWAFLAMAVTLSLLFLFELLWEGLSSICNSNSQLLQIRKVGWAADLFSWKIGWFWWYFSVICGFDEFGYWSLELVAWVWENHWTRVRVKEERMWKEDLLTWCFKKRGDMISYMLLVWKLLNDK